MKQKIMNKRPSQQVLYMQFKAQVKSDPPPKSKIYTNDTAQPVTAIPEYAPMGAVLIAYSGTVAPSPNQTQLVPSGKRAFGIPNDLIVHMQQNDTTDPVQIFVMCDDEAAKFEIDASLSKTAEEIGAPYNADNLHLIPWDTDTYWTRDYGPWWIKNTVTGYYGIAKHTYTTLGGGSVGLVEGAETVDPNEGKGIFRPNDDYAAVALSDFLNAPIRAWNNASWAGDKKLIPLPVHNWLYTGLLDVGGNYMVTSQNKIASSYLVATQNELPVTEEDLLTDPDADVVAKRMEYILGQLNRFMGIKSYHVLTDPTGAYIGHIDCWGKFLSDDKILIAQSQDKKTNQAFDEISKTFEADGFTVYRVMCQDMLIQKAGDPATTAAYTNSLILNDHVYVPMSGPGYEAFDEKAIEAYTNALPDHKIMGIQSKPETPWLGTDAMHCRTRGVPRDIVNTWLTSLAPPAKLS